MSEGFSNPLVGGGGGLVYPSIHSPNFVTGSTGWSINKDGSAEFNNLTVRNGTFISGVFLMYGSAIPAKGNLVVAFAPITGGTDSVGNVYPRGFNFGIWDNTGALKSHFGIDQNGQIYYADSNGLTRIHIEPGIAAQIFYDTNGLSLGHMVQSIASAAGTDQAGNNVGAGFVSYDNVFGGTAQLISAGLSLFSGITLRSTMDQNGFRTFNSHGALIFSVDATRDGWFLYADTGSATQGALLASSASAAGTDQFGNTFDANTNTYVVDPGNNDRWEINLGLLASGFAGVVHAGLAIQNKSFPHFAPPNILAIGRNTGAAELALNSGAATNTSVQSLIALEDSNSGNTAGIIAMQTGLLNIILGGASNTAKAVVNLPDNNTYRIERFTQHMAADIPVGSTTPTTLLTFNVGASTVYKIRGNVRGVNGGAGTLQAQGIRLAGTCTVTSMLIKVRAESDVGSTTAAPTSKGTISALATSVSPAGLIPALSAGFDIEFEGVVSVNAAGTLILQGREETSAADVAWTAKALSWMTLEPE